jgi:hypothetical protein
LEDGIVSQRVVVVLIFISGENAIHPLPHHLQQRVCRLPPGLVECGRELPCEPYLLIELAHDEQPRITREPPGRIFDDDWFLIQKAQTLRPHTL